MARKAYIGVGNKARNVKKIYVSARMLTNLIPYPDMEGSGWDSGNGVSYSTERAYAGTRSLKMVGTSGSAETTCNTAADVQLNNAHFYYAAVFGWQDTKTNGARVGFYWPIAEPSFNDNIPVGDAGQWVRYSATNNRSGFANGGYPFRLDWNNGGTEGTIYYDGAMLIDLTAEFGSGNEPNKEWCDKHIYFTASGQVCVLDMDETSTVNQVKKAYIGIGGKARPCFGEKNTIEHYGRIDDLGEATCQFAASSDGNYALFGGGTNNVRDNHAVLSTVTQYTKSLTRSILEPLSLARDFLGASNVGNVVIFAGGSDWGVRSNVDAYRQGSKISISSLQYYREQLAGAENDSYAIFAGGYGYGARSNVDYYNSSLTHGTASSLSEARTLLNGTTVGQQAIFAGGSSGGSSNSVSNLVDVYNNSMMRSQALPLSVARDLIGAAYVGNKKYALFTGGRDGNSNAVNTVDAYNSSLSKVSVSALSGNRYWHCAASIGGYAIIAGGVDGVAYTTDVEIYDASLTRQVMTNWFSQGRYRLAEATVGDYALFGGGNYSQFGTVMYSANVDAYVYYPEGENVMNPVN